MAKRKHKVLLVGTTGYQFAREDLRVDCCDWTKVSSIKNIRDFDTIILDLLTLSSAESRAAIAWNDFFQRLDFAGAMDVLMSGGEFIILGDPRFHVKLSGEGEEEVDLPFLHWTGIRFAWDSEPGDTVDFTNDYSHREYVDYISRLDKWQYSLTDCELDKEKHSDVINIWCSNKDRESISIKKDAFCVNRYSNALAFILQFELVHEWRNSKDVLQTCGPLIFLPEISLSHDETVQRVLSDICGIEMELQEPEWISEFSAPGQKEIDEEIRRIEGQIESAEKYLEKANTQKQECRNCLKLLYERDFALEPAVRDILRGLGAQVEDPTEPNKEDGWIVVKVGDETYEGVLEIKSTRSDTFNMDGLRQLLEWINNGKIERGNDYKGLFIGNSSVDKPISEREWAFPDNWMKAAKLSKICAFKTEELYLFHVLKAVGKLNLDELWKDIFETNGVLNTKKYWHAFERKKNSDEH